MADPELPLGHVVSVQGSTLTGLLTRTADDEGEALVSVGSWVKIRTRGAVACGTIGCLSLSASGEGPEGRGWIVEIHLHGQIVAGSRSGGAPGFEKGVSLPPNPGSAILAATAADLAGIYARPRAANVAVGTLHHDRTLAAFVDTDRLLGKHFAIVGSTGAGKSCAVSLLLQAILSQHPNGHVVLLDPHNEYAVAFGAIAELINPANLQLPYWLLNLEELGAILVSREGPDRQTEIEILREAVVESRRRFAGGGDEASDITADTPVPFRLSEAARIIDHLMGRLDKPEGARPYQRLLARIEALGADRRFAFMFSGMVVRDNLTDVLSRLLRVPVGGRPITIFDLSGVPSEIVDAVVSVLCRMVFDFAVWSVRTQAVPVLLVCEEAHRYVPADESSGFEPTRRAVARIAKEGRKYGVGLCLVSQRPSELSTTVLSQCNTLFALRLSNDRDQQFVRAVLPEGTGGLLSVLPTLQTQEAVVVGDGVTVPMRLRFNDLPGYCRPASGTAAFASAWQDDTVDRRFLRETIARWRRQQFLWNPSGTADTMAAETAEAVSETID
jgi:hypothetical protein